MTGHFSQSRYGRAVELVSPVSEQVDFHESCNALADINRFAGAARSPVSVAFHTLVGLDMCPESLKPWWAIHDFHEAPLGDWLTPAQRALEEVAHEIAGARGKQIVRDSLHSLKRRHDIAIHIAAGLALPDETQREQIRKLDLICLVTERRDFMRPPPAPWGYETEASMVSSIHYSAGHFGATPIMVAQKLYLKLLKLLPGLNSERWRLARISKHYA